MLLTPLVVTIASRLPATFGEVEKLTVSDVAVADETVPTATPSKSTVLLAAVVSKPNPAMVIVVALAANVVVLLVMTGITLATWTADPLLTLLVVTTAVSGPASVGPVDKVTVNAVPVAELTVPTAPLLNTTVLFEAVVSNPVPLIVKVVALAARLEVLEVTTGTTVATWTAVPLFSVVVETIAVRTPASMGGVENSTVNCVSDAAVTVPAAPSLKATVLFETIGSNPDPVITMAGTSGKMLVVAKFTVTVNNSLSSRDSNGRRLVMPLRLRSLLECVPFLGSNQEKIPRRFQKEGFFLDIIKNSTKRKVAGRSGRISTTGLLANHEKISFLTKAPDLRCRIEVKLRLRQLLCSQLLPEPTGWIQKKIQ